MARSQARETLRVIQVMTRSLCEIAIYGIYFVNQVGLKLTDLPALVSEVWN